MLRHRTKYINHCPSSCNVLCTSAARLGGGGDLLAEAGDFLEWNSAREEHPHRWVVTSEQQNKPPQSPTDLLLISAIKH